MIHKTTRSILSVLLAVLLLVTSIPLTPAFAGGGAVSLPSESGEGRALEQVNGEYQISTAAELQKFAQRVNNGELADANAVLTANIDLSGICSEESDTSWTPIGNEAHRYTGTFDGDGHTISGLYINRSADYQGLFGRVGTGGTVKDLSVSGNVSGSNSVGGVVGYNFSGTVTNCAFSGSVSGSNSVGGVVGWNDSGTVTGCIFSGPGSVSGKISVGGVVGGNSGSNGVVENCYNTGTVTGTRTDDDLGGVGGVVGYNSGTVKNCYNTGKVTGSADSSDVGGVVGWNRGNVKNCYNTGSVTSSGNPLVGDVGMVGGVVGLNDSGTVTDCYFLTGTAEKGIGSDDSGDADPLTVEAFKNHKSFTDWDFGTADTNTWTIHPVLGRPVLNENREGGLGTDKSPYEISTATQLENFRDLVNREGGNPAAHAKLMNDIDLKDVCGKDAGESEEEVSWGPIGTSSSNSYSGTFDGNGHKIENLYINTTDSGAENQGLFGFVGTGGTVQNLTVSGNVSGDEDVGGVVGYNNGGTVTGCIFSGSGSVSGPGNRVGGVVGRNFGGTVENCYNTGSVNGSADSSNVGGVVGRNFRGTVENCYNTGSVSGPGNRVGGVVGYNNGSSTVTGCYFLQTETVNTKLQGIGENDGSGVATATEKDDTAFHSGEVAYLLEQNVENSEKPVWGQSNLNTDKSWPTLVALDNSAQPVYQVTFDYGTSFTDIDERFAYSYTNGVVSKPDKNPELDGHTLSGWYSDESLTTEWNFDTEISNDTTLYAKWTAVEESDPDPEPTPEPEPEEPPYTGKYSYEVSTSVGDHGSLTVDRYATEGDKVTIDVTPDQAYKLDDLSVTANGKDVELTANGDGTYTFTMPSADVKITATFAEDPDWTEPEEPATDVSDIFLDIAPDAWYKDAVQYAYDNGLMTGVSDTEFAPEATTTRAMIVSILARLEGVTTAEAAGFADVDDNDWYATAVNWAANVGVVNGYEDNTFQPNTAITREQLAAILMNYAAYKGEDVSNRADLTSYTDQPSTWAQEAISWSVAEGLLTGVTADTLQPQGAATRAQVAAILQRFLSE